jgi:hypothetical protein
MPTQEKLARPYLKNKRGWVLWYMPVIPATQEAEAVESKFKASLGKKLARTSISNNKLGMALYFCNPSYAASLSRRTTVHHWPWTKM